MRQRKEEHFMWLIKKKKKPKTLQEKYKPKSFMNMNANILNKMLPN